MPKKAKIPSYKVNVDKESHKENAKESLHAGLYFNLNFKNMVTSISITL